MDSDFKRSQSCPLDPTDHERRKREVREAAREEVETPSERKLREVREAAREEAGFGTPSERKFGDVQEALKGAGWDRRPLLFAPGAVAAQTRSLLLRKRHHPLLRARSEGDSWLARMPQDAGQHERVAHPNGRAVRPTNSTTPQKPQRRMSIRSNSVSISSEDSSAFMQGCGPPPTKSYDPRSFAACAGAHWTGQSRVQRPCNPCQAASSFCICIWRLVYYGKLVPVPDVSLPLERGGSVRLDKSA